MAATISVVTNGEQTALVLGEVVRASGNGAVVRARANTVGNAQGTLGAMSNPGTTPGTNDSTAAGANGTLSADGQTYVLLDTGLTPVVGQTLFLSAATAGRATNVAPAVSGDAVLPIGIITDISPYVSLVRVLADVDPNLVPVAVP
jgi:hypothetical protein